jgi:hypothetical protein
MDNATMGVQIKAQKANTKAICTPSQPTQKESMFSETAW